MSEAGLLPRIEIVRCDPEDAAFDSIKARLAAGTGEPATFPTAEIERDRYMSDSDRLIDHFARAHGIVPGTLPALAFYKESIFPQLDALHGGAHHVAP